MLIMRKTYGPHAVLKGTMLEMRASKGVSACLHVCRDVRALNTVRHTVPLGLEGGGWLSSQMRKANVRTQKKESLEKFELKTKKCVCVSISGFA